MARKEYELMDGIEVYNKDAGDYIKSKDLVIDYKGQKGSTFVRSLQDEIFSYLKDLPSSDNSKSSGDDGEKMTAETIISIVSISGNSSKLYNLIINSLKSFGYINSTKCTDTMLDSLSENDNDLIYEAVISDFLSQKVIRQIANMSR